MSHTPSLFGDDDEPPPIVPAPTRGSIQERFLVFHKNNEWVYRALERLVEQYAATGRKRMGIRMLWERLRWEYNTLTKDPSSEFKLSDHYHSRYVRLLIQNHPEWAGLFELRKLKAK
jgi:hypothetical protein